MTLDYRVYDFVGKYSDLVKELDSLNKRPLHIDEIVEQKVMALEQRDWLKGHVWLTQYFDSCDSMIYHPNGDIKVVRGSQRLLDLPNNKRRISRDGALVLSEKEFESSEGVVISDQELKNYEFESSNMSRIDEVRNNPFWKILVPDQKLLEKYEMYAGNTTANYYFMGVQLDYNKPRKLIKERFIGINYFNEPYKSLCPKVGDLHCCFITSNLKKNTSRLIGISK